MIATGSNAKANETQVAILLHIIGEEALEKYNTFELNAEDKNNFEKVLEAFENYCTPQSNESVDRHIFFARSQQAGETFDEFLTDLKKLSSSCGFGELRDSLIRDRIISGIYDKNLKDRLLREGQLTLQKCMKMCKASELAEMQLKTLNDDHKIEAVKFNKVTSYRKPNESQFKQQQSKPAPRPPYVNKQNNAANTNRFDNSKPCRRCGKFHKRFNCPAYNKICAFCKQKNHFARMCFKKNINFVENDSSDRRDSDDDFSPEDNISKDFILGAVNKNNEIKSKDWYEKLKINISKYLYVKIDTGAQCNVLPLPRYNRLKLRENCLKKSELKLSNYSGSKINVIGQCNLKCETSKGDKEMVEFQVVECDSNVPAVLGLPTIQKLNLVQRVNSIKMLQDPLNEYKDLFTGTGKLDGYVYDIKLKQGAVGKIEPCRKIPISMMDPLKSELCKMETMGVIRKINEPTEFVSSLVVVKKNDGSLRICLDPQYLNENILREHYHLPTFEEIACRMSGAKVFSILDANKAFWQIELSQSSSPLTTFNTPFGRYCFLRLPYGLNSAPEVFQRSFSEIFNEIEGVEIYIDDLLVWGRDKKEHDARLKKVLEKAREKNVKFNLNKCKIGLDEVKYMGHKFSKYGLKLDEDKIKAIVNMKTPLNVKELETFLGMITYVSRFIPNVSQMTSTLRDLLKKECIWKWDAIQEKAFNDLKNVLVNKPVLQFFDVNKPITLSVDASQEGLGGVLLQDNLPVAYASKALTETQKNYAQIEKETLAIVFGCENFYQYIYGKSFTVESDHKPLESIFKKPLNKCPVRLQRMRIRLQPFDLKIVYKPGRELFIADALSRSFLDEPSDSFNNEIEAHVGMITENLPMSREKFKIFQNETLMDEELQAVKKFIINGWPNNIKLLPDIAKPYYNFKEELSEGNGLILKNSCVVVPRNLRKDMLNRIHYSHLGMEKCKNKAREILYWPNMSKEIEDVVKNCSTCLSFQRSNTKEPLMPKDVPDRPWQVLGADLYNLQGKEYLNVVDYFSKYVEVALLSELSSSAIINSLKSFFARHGIPDIVYSDNGPQFNSRKFREFARSWNFESKTSSPNFPQSNGMVERYIQTVKNILKKALHDNKDPHLALLEYRNTPISNTIKSPSEIMYGRKVKGLMPVKEDFFPTYHYQNVRQELLNRQAIQKKYYDRGSRELKPLSELENVFIKTRGKGPHENAQVIMPSPNRPRSYKIMKKDGRVIERNRRDIMKGTDRLDFRVERPAEGTEEIVESPTPHDHIMQNFDPVQNAVNKRDCIDQPETVTRSGRTIRKPSYLSDYI